MDQSSHFFDMKRGNTVFTVNPNVRRRKILSIYCVFWILIILDYWDGTLTTQCTQTSEYFSIPVSSLCYKSSASANRVVLDGFLTYRSSTTVCNCTLTSSTSTTVRISALKNLHPYQTSCGSIIRVHSGATALIINCYISGDFPVSSTQAVTLSFEKPSFGYNSNYCMLLSSDNVNAVLNLNCNGDLNFSTSTAKHSSTLSTRTMTELSSKSSTTPASTTPRTTPPPPSTTTTKTHRTTTPTTTLTATTTDILSQMTDISATLSTLSPIAPQSATSTQSTASIHVESPALSIWILAVPATGAGIVLICVTVLVVCFCHRRKHKTPSNDRTVVYVNETEINLPYSPDYKYEERSSEIARGSSKHIYDVIL